MLCQQKWAVAARSFGDAVAPGRAEVLVGDIASMHLGLSGTEYENLRQSVQLIFHAASTTHPSTERPQAKRVNLVGTRNMLELAQECPRLKRMVHVSSAFVSGDRLGVIAEDEFQMGQKFRSVFEETKFEAEAEVRRVIDRLPICIARPSTVVGHSKTGETDFFDGPYAVGAMLLLSKMALPVPLPDNGGAPLNVVPVDFVAQALWALGHVEGAEGATVHLVDPNPMSARRVYERLAERTKQRLPRFQLSAKAADFLLRLPGLEQLTRPQRSAFHSVNQLALYTCQRAKALLSPQGIFCPPLDSYLEVIFTYALDHWKKQKAEAPAEDPLDADGPKR